MYKWQYLHSAKDLSLIPLEISKNFNDKFPQTGQSLVSEEKSKSLFTLISSLLNPELFSIYGNEYADLPKDFKIFKLDNPERNFLHSG